MAPILTSRVKGLALSMTHMLSNEKPGFKNGATPHALFLDRIDPVWALEQAQWIQQNIPFMQKANGSGKFYSNYLSYGFWRDSEQPLIRKFIEALEQHGERFKATYQRELKVNYVYLSYVEDASQDSCILHKDGYWWNGQFHLTIQGNASIEIIDNGLKMKLDAENGSLWYLSGTDYAHRIVPQHKGPRFELLAPCDLRADSSAHHYAAVTSTRERWIDGNHPELMREQRKAVDHIKAAIAGRRASNLEVASWPETPNGTKID